MNQSKVHNFLLQNVSALKGVGNKTKKLLKKKKIEKISDLLWNFPQGFTDRSNVQKLNKLETLEEACDDLIMEASTQGELTKQLNEMLGYVGIQWNSFKSSE